MAIASANTSTSTAAPSCEGRLAERLQFTLDHLACPRVKRDLARGKHQPLCDGSLGVRADRRGGVGGLERPMVGHG